MWLKCRSLPEGAAPARGPHTGGTSTSGKGCRLQVAGRNGRGSGGSPAASGGGVALGAGATLRPRTAPPRRRRVWRRKSARRMRGGKIRLAASEGATRWGAGKCQARQAAGQAQGLQTVRRQLASPPLVGAGHQPLSRSAKRVADGPEGRLPDTVRRLHGRRPTAGGAHQTGGEDQRLQGGDTKSSGVQEVGKRQMVEAWMQAGGVDLPLRQETKVNRAKTENRGACAW